MLLFRFQLVEQGIESLKVSFPDLPVPLNPNLQFLERCGPQSINSALRVHSNVHKTRPAEHPQMLRDLRLPKPEAVDKIADRPRPGKQQLDDVKPVRFGQRSKCLGYHAANMPHLEYSCQGICVLGNIPRL